MQPRKEKVFTRFSKPARTSSRASPFAWSSSPRRARAENAKRRHDTEHAGDDTT